MSCYQNQFFPFLPFSEFCHCRLNFNMIFINYDGLESSIILTKHKALPVGIFREEVKNVKNMLLGKSFYRQCWERHQYLRGITQAYD